MTKPSTGETTQQTFLQMTNPKPPPELLGAPPGTIPNLVNPVNQTEFFIVLHSICLVIITLGLAMRLYTRKFIVKRLKVDDYLCVFAYLLTVAGTGVNLLATLEGNGTHIWDLDWEGDQLKRIFRASQFTQTALDFL
ncbi:hypothetical protein HYFRA_00012265 [Hymenoscyphus fraxineus]|uniref:Rhodopsin domain-containing protein n=1 Tax=Hymenoscyphus fraxineus TaxID=746836 RepID=A0A9N9PRB5_9HELO|nr:hypothetical protein HYFRA_00012265 [Hymenoscyphus fraxineus]